MTAPAQPPAPTPPTLEDHVRAGFIFSNHLWIWAVLLDCLAVTVGLFGIAVKPLADSWIFWLFSLVPYLLAFWVRTKQQGVHSLAERSRRSNLLAAGLGVALDPKLVDDLMADVANAVKENIPKLAHGYTYYDNTDAPSLKRFAENLHESIVFSRRLYKRTASRYHLILVVGFLIVLIGSYAGLSQANAQDKITVTQVLQAVIAFLATSNLIPVWQFFHQGERELDGMDSELQRHRQGALNREGLLLTMSDYNALMSHSYPIPNRIYNHVRTELTQQFQARNRSTKGTP